VPGPEGVGGTLVGGGALYIVARSSPARQEAAWRFARFLNGADQQAFWAASTGYVPIRRSAVGLPTLEARWDEVPQFQVAYEQLLQGVENPASAGPVIGDYEAVRRAVVHAFEQLSQGTAPDDALAGAATAANEAIADYERRVAP